MNQIDPDYAVDPSVGGEMAHTPNYRNPNANTGVSRQEMIDGYIAQGMTGKDAAATVNAILGPAGSSASSTGSQGMINAIYGNRSTGSYNTKTVKFGGATGYYVLGGNVYPF